MPNSACLDYWTRRVTLLSTINRMAFPASGPVDKAGASTLKGRADSTIAQHRLFAKGIDHRLTQLPEHTAKNHTQQFVGKFKFQFQGHPAAVFAMGGKMPDALEGFKRSILQLHGNGAVFLQRIDRGEREAHTALGNSYGRTHPVILLLMNLGSGA